MIVDSNLGVTKNKKQEEEEKSRKLHNLSFDSSKWFEIIAVLLKGMIH